MLYIVSTEMEFVAICSLLDNDSIYEFFSADVFPDTKITVKKQFRDEVLNRYSNEDDSEPTRATLNALGQKYNIQSLIDY